jgi:AraC-like DNA-binding protein
MFLRFEHRLSDSPFVERVWRSYSTTGGSFYSMAEPNLELVVARLGGPARVILRGPVTRASSVECPAGGEWLGIRFRLGAHLPGLPTANLLDHRSLALPNVGGGRFWLKGRAWELPTFDNAETFATRLAAAGVIARDGVVELALGGRKADVSLRSLQRRFLRSTGMTRDGFRQIERARHAAHLLRGGMPVLDVVDRAGYFDQPHLSRALRRLIGPTPGALLRSEAQLSFLYKTIPPARA